MCSERSVIVLILFLRNIDSKFFDAAVGLSLPHVIQELTDSNIFKRKLKTFLFEHAFSIHCDSFLSLVTFRDAPIV